MSNFSVPYEFVGGTKARAEEVNANFSAVSNAINLKVDKNFDGTIDVAAAIDANNAVNKGQLTNILTTTLNTVADTNLSNISNNALRKLTNEIYSINSGNINSYGEADLLDISDDTKIVFNIDEETPLIGTLAGGNEFTRTSIPDLNLLSLPNGTYNIFVSATGACIPIANTIYRQKNEPQPFAEQEWTQPVLSANGTMGGSSFAVSVTSTGSAPDNNTYLAFDNNDNTITQVGNGTTTLKLYNPNKLKISQFSYSFGAYGKNWEVYGSDDNSNWTQITVSQNPNANSGTVILDNNNYFNYYKIVFQNGAAMSLNVYTITLTATEGINEYITNAIWLDTSVKPYKSYKYDGTDWQEFNYVPLPQTVTVSNGRAISVDNSGNYNKNQYDEFVLLPDVTRVTSLTQNITYTASVNGWISNSSALLRPLLIGERFTPNTNDYKFYAMKGV